MISWILQNGGDTSTHLFFWPRTANEIAELILVYGFMIGAAIGSAWRWLLKPIRDEIKLARAGHEEIKGVAANAVDKAHIAIGKVDAMRIEMEGMKTDCADNAAAINRLVGRFDEAVTQRHQDELKRMDELRKIDVTLQHVSTTQQHILTRISQLEQK
jgi:HAMP domain-containing protein